MKSIILLIIVFLFPMMGTAAHAQQGSGGTAVDGAFSASELNLPDLAHADAVCVDDVIPEFGLAAPGEGKFYAECVAADGYKAAGGSKYVGKAYSNPALALGAPDRLDPIINPGVVSIGNAESDGQSDPRSCEGHLILEFFSVSIFDGPGPDIKIYEAGTSVGGVTEAMHVYVSPDDSGDWFYVGRTDEVGEIDKDVISMDLSGSGAPPAAVFEFVALCDVADGITSGFHVGGPDVDAVEALNWTYDSTSPAILATAHGDENVINDRPMPDGETRRVDEGDKMSSGQDSDIEYFKACREGLLRAIKFANAAADKGNLKMLVYYLRAIVSLQSDCPTSPKILSAQDVLEFEVVEGALAVETMYEDLALTVRTATASTASEGRARFEVAYGKDTGRSTIRAISGALRIVPAKPGAPPFVLNEGYSVVITAESVGEPFADARLFLPLVRGN